MGLSGKTPSCCVSRKVTSLISSRLCQLSARQCIWRGGCNQEIDEYIFADNRLQANTPWNQTSQAFPPRKRILLTRMLSTAQLEFCCYRRLGGSYHRHFEAPHKQRRLPGPLHCIRAHGHRPSPGHPVHTNLIFKKDFHSIIIVHTDHNISTATDRRALPILRVPSRSTIIVWPISY
jgi:hypothetical protein